MLQLRMGISELPRLTKVITLSSFLLITTTFCGFELPESSGEADPECLNQCQDEFERRKTLCGNKYSDDASYEICVGDAEGRLDRCERACEM